MSQDVLTIWRGTATLLPELILMATLVGIFLWDIARGGKRGGDLPLYLIYLGSAVALGLTLQGNPGAQSKVFSGMVGTNGLGYFFRLLAYASLPLFAWLGFRSKEIGEDSRTEWLLLLGFAALGTLFTVFSKHLLMLFLSLETLSLASYCLAGFKRHHALASEGAVKYLLFGATCSAVSLYGMSLIFGLTGQLTYEGIGVAWKLLSGLELFVLQFSFLLFLVGLLFKISAFPTHFWTPDVYEGAPVATVAFLATGPKAAAFLALIRVFQEMQGTGPASAAAPAFLTLIVALLSAATMTWGNLGAIRQVSVKRLMGYSSIAHVGYLMMGLIPAGPYGIRAILFYIAVYYLMNLGTFWTLQNFERRYGATHLHHFAGLGRKQPLAAFSLTIFLFSFAGLPIFSGFVGKFLIFSSLVQSQSFLWLAVLGVLNSVVSLYYYAKIIRSMWLEDVVAIPETDAIRVSWVFEKGVPIGLAIPTILLGIFFSPLLFLIERSLLFH